MKIVPKSPNLAPADKIDLDKIVYPIFASEKYDGVRAIINEGTAWSRKLLPLHDVFHKRFKPFLDKTIGTNHVLDVEVFNPTASFTEITSSLANEDGVQLWLYVFDYMTAIEWNGTPSTTFTIREQMTRRVLEELDPECEYCRVVPQMLCHSKEEVLEFYESIIDVGGEGVMLRSPHQVYKQGRSTGKAQPNKGGGFYKLKAFDTLDAIIIGFENKRRLTEEAKEYITEKDAFGRSKRGHRKDDRIDVDEIGKVICQVPDRFYTDDKGNEQPFIFKSTWTKGSPVRTEITWDNKDQYIGRWVEIEYMSVGMKNLPRLPRIKRFRPDLD